VKDAESQRAAPPVWLAAPGEAQTVARLMTEFRDHAGRDGPSDNAFLAGVERLLDERATDYLLASPDPDAAPAGVCQLRYRHSLWTAAEDCWLEDLFVREGARGRGVGAALLEAVVARARERGCRRIELDVSEANEPALRLYERFGFSASHKTEPPARSLYLGLRLGESGAP